MSKCLSTHSLFRHMSLIITWFSQDRRESRVHKSDGDLLLIQSPDRWYHRYWSLPWFRACACALWSSWHVTRESSAPPPRNDQRNCLRDPSQAYAMVGTVAYSSLCAVSEMTSVRF